MVSVDYLAGMIDADGYIGVVYNKRQNHYNIQMTITNNHIGMLQTMQKLYGGKIDYKWFSNPKHRNQFILKWSGAEALQVLAMFRHKLIVKKDQADLVITFPRGYGADKKRQQFICNELKRLKHINYLPPQELINKGIKKHERMSEKRDKAITLASHGLLGKEIAAKIGVSEAMVSKYLQ